LSKLKGIEDRTWVQVEGCARIYAVADEDLERENEDKTSAVHFLRFELSQEMKTALACGAGLSMGVDHPNYQADLGPVSPKIRASLVQDLD
jgi:streptomycin 6-kinase